MDPGVEPVRIAEARQVTPGDHQRVLQGILGPVDIPEDPMRDREEPAAAEADQVDERRLIASLCRLDEIAIHRLSRGWRPSGAPSTCIGRSCAPSVGKSSGRLVGAEISGSTILTDHVCQSILRGMTPGPTPRTAGEESADDAPADHRCRRRGCIASTASPGTTLQAMAERADVARGTVLNHFGGADGLLEAVLDDVAEEVDYPDERDPGWRRDEPEDGSGDTWTRCSGSTSGARWAGRRSAATWSIRPS